MTTRVFISLGPSPSCANDTWPLGQEFDLGKADSHHLTNVLRLDTGAEIVANCQDSGQRFLAVISAIKPILKLKLVDKLETYKFNSAVKSLSFALCKGEKNDLVIEKLTELGVDQIIIWQAQRSVAQITADKLRAKLTRWTSIAKAAAMQSGRNSVPQISFAQNIKHCIEILDKISGRNDLKLFGSLTRDSKTLKSLPPPTSTAHLLIGPEGDLTEDEQTALNGQGFTPISLGPWVLRAETAAIAACAACQALWDWNKQAKNQ